MVAPQTVLMSGGEHSIAAGPADNRHTPWAAGPWNSLASDSTGSMRASAGLHMAATVLRRMGMTMLLPELAA